MLIDDLANKQRSVICLIIIISIFVLSSLFQYSNIYAQILNNKPFDTIENQSNNILNTIKDIPVGEYPESIAINQNTNTVYVVNSESNTISVISGENNTKVNE